MVNEYLGYGLKGLIVSVLVAAVVSTLNSGLNSFSTIYTLDIHIRWISPGASERHATRVGRVTTLLAGLMAVGIALYLKQTQESGSLNLFDLFQSIIGYMAPPISAVFVLGILWRRSTATAALTTLVLGSVVCLGIGIYSLGAADTKDAAEVADTLEASATPTLIDMASTSVGVLLERFCSFHFLMQSFSLFASLLVLMVVVSLATKHSETESPLPTLHDAYRGQQGLGRAGMMGWAVLAVIMLTLYCLFQFAM